MNYNLIGYAIFTTVIIFVIVVVGKICYRNGNVFVSALIPNHVELCQQINKILLVGYYLVNIGYCAMTLIYWEKIITVSQLVEVVAVKVAIIVCIISVLNYINIFVLTYNAQKLIKQQ